MYYNNNKSYNKKYPNNNNNSFYENKPKNIQAKNATMNPYDLMVKIEKDKTVKNISFDVPFRKDVTLYDLSIHGRGTEEDQIYAFDEWYRIHIRRGNTIIQIFDDKNNVLDTIFGRKGFEKFFDLTYEYILYNLQEIKSLQQNFGIKDGDEHVQLHNIIFREAEKTLKNGNNHILIYKLVKANGENAQVTWVKPLNAWLIASKNVSLLARKREDLELYAQERFYFAKLIGEAWFNQLESIIANKQLEELKHDMTDKTFVGEYCGNQYHQHLVKYTKIEVLFVAVVENYSYKTCIPPEKAYEIFKKYNLSCVPKELVGKYNDWAAFNKRLQKLYKDVAISDIDIEQEGSVLYFVKEDYKGDQEVLSLSKLKTLEYRIYRKLREKLRNFISRSNQKGSNNKGSNAYDHILDRYSSEVRDLCKESLPPNPLEFYYEVAKIAFEYVINYPTNTNIIHEQYISFISILLNCKHKKIALNPKLFDQSTIQKTLEIPWITYKQEIQQIEKTSTLNGDTTVTTTNTTTTQNNIGTTIPNSASNGAQALMASQNVTTTDATLNKIAMPKQKMVYIIIQLGIPGLGKTFLIKQIEKMIPSSMQLSVISSDQIRRECMEKLSKKNTKLSIKELYEQTMAEARDLFNERLGELIFYSDKRNCDAHVIFIDKNHPPNALKGTFNIINANSKHLNVKKVAFYPDTKSSFEYTNSKGQKISYPFSLNLFLNCLNRVQNRQNHETLNGNGPDSASVMFMFFDFYKNVLLNEASILKNGFDMSIRIPFTDESEEYEKAIPQAIRTHVINILEMTRNTNNSTKDPQVLATIKDFLDELAKTTSIVYKFSSTDQISERVSNFFNKIRKTEEKKTNEQSITLVPKQAETVIEETKVAIQDNNPQKVVVVEETKVVIQEKISQNMNAIEEIKTQNQPIEETKTEEPVIKIEPKVQTPVEEKKAVEEKKPEQAILNPPKLPKYLGIFPKVDVSSKIQEYLLMNMKKLAERYQDDKIFRFNFQELKSKKYDWLKPVKDYHITSLFIGNNNQKVNTPHFKTFKEGHELDITIYGIAYVPNKIITAIAHVDQSVIKIENEFPHVTLATGTWNSKFSNDLLQALCSKNGPICNDYDKNKIQNEKEYAQRYKVNVGNSNVMAYVFKFTPNLVLPSVSKPWY